MRKPFPEHGIRPDERGVRHYVSLPGSLVEMLRAQAEIRPDAEAVVEVGGDRMTYRQLWDAAARVAGGLRESGLAARDRVAIGYPAGLGWVLAFWGALLAGAVPVALNTRWSREETGFVLDDCGARVHLAPDTPLPAGPPVVVNDLVSSDVAAMFYTSGTTGRNRGVPTTHVAFLTNAENAVRCFGLSGDEIRTLICVPLFHVTGCNSQLLVAAYTGGTAVILPELDLAAVLTALVRERISFLLTVPAIYSLLLRHPRFPGTDTSRVRRVAYGGAPMSPSLVASLRDAFPSAAFFNAYGMTETASLATVLPDRGTADHVDSVGYAAPVVDLRLDPLGDDPNTGELLVRGPNVLSAYWNRPDATAEALRDGWLRTGDVVRLDGAGRVHVIDRLKDIINRGGEKVSTVEVEAVLAAVPGVVEAAVVAVPDDVMGEKVGAVIVKGREPVDVTALLEHCRTRLADFKVPQYVVVQPDPLPRNPSGKVLKPRLRAEVRWGSPLR